MLLDFHIVCEGLKKKLLANNQKQSINVSSKVLTFIQSGHSIQAVSIWGSQQIQQDMYCCELLDTHPILV